jgi:hypothetical protein
LYVYGTRPRARVWRATVQGRLMRYIYKSMEGYCPREINEVYI